jgi:bacterioferritin (cytochrome b1)
MKTRLSYVGQLKDRAIRSYRGKIREAAITKAKAKIALHGNTIDDYSRDQLEAIVAEEERDVISQLKSKSLVALLAILGFGAI